MHVEDCISGSWLCKKEQNMKIDSYSFGSITVDGQTYDQDIILLPNRVHTSWHRREGHRLSIEDLSEVIEYKPEVLIVGTGAHGVMEIQAETKQALKQFGIELIENKTAQACDIFNEHIQKGKKVVGAFHLTC